MEPADELTGENGEADLPALARPAPLSLTRPTVLNYCSPSRLGQSRLANRVTRRASCFTAARFIRGSPFGPSPRSSCCDYDQTALFRPLRNSLPVSSKRTGAD